MVEPVFAQIKNNLRAGRLYERRGWISDRPPDVLPRSRRRRYPIPAEPARGRRRSGAAGKWRERAAELAVTADGNRAKQIMQRQAVPLPGAPGADWRRAHADGAGAKRPRAALWRPAGEHAL